nr:MAG TPA: hypothetical protein [Caudoviricetes sp.]
MSLIFILYLVDIVETVQVVMFVFWVSFLAIATLICMILIAEGSTEGIVDFFTSKKVSAILAALLCVTILLPSKQTLYIAAGTLYAETFVEKLEASPLVVKTLKLLELKLDQELTPEEGKK